MIATLFLDVQAAQTVTWRGSFIAGCRRTIAYRMAWARIICFGPAVEAHHPGAEALEDARCPMRYVVMAGRRRFRRSWSVYNGAAGRVVAGGLSLTKAMNLCTLLNAASASDEAVPRRAPQGSAG